MNKEPKEKRRVKIKLEIIPEDKNLYSLYWSDTIGRNENASTVNRLRELWCVLKVGNDTIGHYWGLSTPQDFTYFQTTDSIIKAEFKIGPNVFSPKMTKELFDKNREIVEFVPIDIHIKGHLRKEIEWVLVEK